MRQLFKGEKKRTTIRRNAPRSVLGCFLQIYHPRASGWTCIQLPLPAYSSLVNPDPIVRYPLNSRSTANYSRHYALCASRLSRYALATLQVVRISCTRMKFPTLLMNYWRRECRSMYNSIKILFRQFKNYFAKYYNIDCCYISHKLIAICLDRGLIKQTFNASIFFETSQYSSYYTFNFNVHQKTRLM